MSNLDKKMNAENLEGYEIFKTLLYGEASLWFNSVLYT